MCQLWEGSSQPLQSWLLPTGGGTGSGGDVPTGGELLATPAPAGGALGKVQPLLNRSDFPACGNVQPHAPDPRVPLTQLISFDLLFNPEYQRKKRQHGGEHHNWKGKGRARFVIWFLIHVQIETQPPICICPRTLESTTAPFQGPPPALYYPI